MGLKNLWGKMAAVAGLLTLTATMCVLVAHRTACAGQMAAITGNHLSGAGLGAELAGTQTIQAAVIMALNNRADLNQLEADLQNRDSPRYRQWLTPQQFADRFGPTSQQMQAVVNWLNGQGLTVTSSDRMMRAVRFSASYAAIKAALQVKIVTDGDSWASINDPQVPAELAPTIVSIEGLTRHGGTHFNSSETLVTTCTTTSDGLPCNDNPHFGPGDLYTYYDETPVLQGGNLGTGAAGSSTANDCIALPENGGTVPAAITLFDNEFTGLPLPGGTLPAASVSTVGNNPGLPSDNEPYLDIEWAHAVSPNTPIVVYYNNSSYLDVVQTMVNDNRCGVIASSIEGGCDPLTTVVAISDAELQATTQGQTYFKAAGDYGDNWYCGTILTPPPTPSGGNPAPAPYDQSDCGYNSYTDPQNKTYQPSINEEAASPYITSVGGTQFTPAYDSSNNDESVVSEGLDHTWNAGDPTPTPVAPRQENCPIKDAGAGGVSQVFSKPTWQTGVGVPNDRARDIPDVSMGANGVIVGAPISTPMPGFFVGTLQEPGASSNTCNPKDQPCFTLTGGTSIATPMWAGISRLIAQAQGVTRLGNINARLYELGNLQSASSGLIDVTQGNNSDAAIPGYSAGPGYDQATGWGVPDIAKLVAAFPGAAATATAVSTLVKAGTNADAGSFTLTNTTGAALSLTSITVSLTTPGVFATLTMTATVEGGSPQTASATPSSSAQFLFATPVNIPSGGTATFALQGITASKAPAAAGLIGGFGDRGPRAGSGGRALWIWMIVLLAGAAAIRPRWRMHWIAAGLILIAAIATSCGGSSGSSTSGGSKQSSTQSIAQGAIRISDGQGGWVEASGLPATLGSVTVKF